MSQEAIPPVLTASVHDVRYFATLLRGVNFASRATITVTKRGLTITVEEARTLLGTAFIFSQIFDEYIYNSENRSPPNSPQNSEDEGGEEVDNAAFEIPLNTLIECLNIFGTAGSISSTYNAGSKHKRWRKPEDGASDQEENERERRNGGGREHAGRTIDSYFSGPEKRTTMRMSFAGPGYPLILLIAEDAAGPTTTCEITTFDPEPHLELEFNNSGLVLKIILRSSWLRDALSELDPSCEKLTFIGNPPPDPTTKIDGRQRRKPRQPILRIQAVGTFGATEMDYPNDRDVLETFECTRSIKYSYRFGHISKTIRALQTSTKTSLRIDDEGLLSFQFLMPSPKLQASTAESTDAFIEFRCLALDDE